MKYTNEQIEAMYLDWFNNFMSTYKFREYYNLTTSEAENIIDMGRVLNNRNK